MRRFIAPLLILMLTGCTATQPSNPLSSADRPSPTVVRSSVRSSVRSADHQSSKPSPTPAQKTSPSVPSVPILATAPPSVVVSVGDGDTLRVRTGSKAETVRLACIDAPERDQIGGDAATQRLKQLVPPGATVQLRPVDTDRYGRTVAEVYRDSRSVNLQLVAEGVVVVYPAYLDGCASDRTEYLRAEQQARQQQLGFWQQPNLQMPWEWRQANRDSTPSAPTEPAAQPAPDAQGLPNCVNFDCDCKDFQTQAAAQRVFEAFPDDRFRLDRDGDRRVCESLP